MKQMHRLFATLSITAVIAGFSVPMSHADDYKVFPGAMCRLISGSGGIAKYDLSGRLLNSSSTTMVVICPIVRDNETGAPMFQVIVIDQHLSKGVACRGVSNSRDGTTRILTKTKESSKEGNASTGVPLSLGGIASKQEFGAHHIQCTIPEKGADNSAIASYVLKEP